MTTVASLSALRRLVGKMRAERTPSDYLPQFSHVMPDVVRNVDGSAHALFEAEGARFEGLDRVGLAAQHNRLCELHRTLNLQHRLTLHAYLIHTEATDADLPAPSSRGLSFPAEMDRAYRRHLLGGARLWRNTLLFGVTVRPPSLSSTQARTTSRDPVTIDQADLDVLEQVMATIRADLGRDYGLRRLALRDDAGVLCSEMAEAHALILTGRRRRVPLPQGRLSRAICPHRPVARPDKTLALHDVAGTTEAALFGLSVYPVESDAAMFDVLLRVPYRFVLAQSMGTSPLHEAQGLVTRTSNRFISSGDPAATQLAELEIAADELQQRAYGMGLHNLTMMVLADDAAALKLASAAADDDLRASGAIVSRLDWDQEAGYFGLSPGTEALHCRAAPIKTRNFAAFAPLHAFAGGWRGGKWCDVVATFTTNGGTPYHWNPHTSEAGGPGGVPHMLVTGPTDSGKTTVVAWLLAHLMNRAGSRVVLWDKDRGLKLLVMRLGGSYVQIRIGQDSGLAPLRALSGDDPADMAFLSDGIRALILSDGGPPIEHEAGRRIDLALRTVMAMDPTSRSLGEVCAFLGAASDAVGNRLRPWCAGEPLGWVWDNARDGIALDAPIVGFDQTHYLDHRVACGPIQSYLFHRTGKLVGRGPMVVAIDEFQKSLQNPAFRGLMSNGLATFRKEDCAMWLITQSASTARQAESIAHAIREQCLTQMHFPSGAANWLDFGPEGLGFTETAFEWVRSGLSGGGRGRFLLKQGTQYTPVRLDLGGMDDVLAVLSGNSATVALMDRVQADLPDAGTDVLFAEWHRRRKALSTGALV